MRLSKTLLGASTVLQPMERKEEMGLEGWQAGSWGWPYKVKSAVNSCQSSVSAAGTVGGSWNTDWESEWHINGYTHNLSYICPCGCTEYMEVDFEVKPLNSHFLCVCPLFPFLSFLIFGALILLLFLFSGKWRMRTGPVQKQESQQMCPTYGWINTKHFGFNMIQNQYLK